MNLQIKVKQPGRKHPLLDKKIITVEGLNSQTNLQTLIEAIVHQQVVEYNSKSPEKNILPFLSQSQIEEQGVAGKVSFGSIYNENKADVEQAKKNALQAYEDGIFVVFVNDEEIKQLNSIITLPANSVIIFIRLTFLAGSYW